MLEVGQVIGGRLRVDRIIGVGGFGVVAAATHLEMKTQLAVKMLKPEFKHDEEIIERFLREARAVAALKTEHVCQVFDVARTEDGDPYIVMELLQGGDVASMIKSNPLPASTAVDFVVQACIGLAAAHAHGIVHRDLKPPNLFVMRRPDGMGSMVKVLDFGIAKAADELRLTHSMTMLGSPQYMSPEQLTSPRTVDARSDIWSLGVTLYHMIARRLPFPSAQIGELAVMITSHPPVPLECDPGLAAVIYKCLEKNQAARFQDVGALAAALAPYGTPTTRGYAAQVRSPGARSAPIPVAPPIAHPVAQHASTMASHAGPQHPSTMASHGGANPATLASHAGPQHPSTMVPHAAPPLAVPRRSRALLWVPLGIVLVGGGVLAGFLARGSSSEKPSATAAAKPADPVSKPEIAIDAAPAIDAASVVAEAPAKFDSEQARLRYELGQMEKNMLATNDPATLQILYFHAIGMACAAREVDKAQLYLSKLHDEAKRRQSVGVCAQYKVELSLTPR